MKNILPEQLDLIKLHIIDPYGMTEQQRKELHYLLNNQENFREQFEQMVLEQAQAERQLEQSEAFLQMKGMLKQAMKQYNEVELADSKLKILLPQPAPITQYTAEQREALFASNPNLESLFARASTRSDDNETPELENIIHTLQQEEDCGNSLPIQIKISIDFDVRVLVQNNKGKDTLDTVLTAQELNDKQTIKIPTNFDIGRYYLSINPTDEDKEEIMGVIRRVIFKNKDLIPTE